jgi:peptidoglycan/LPS O-acetylase OafA/YrhL
MIAMKLPNHIPQLDMLRGVAVLNVMLYHITDIAPNLQLRPFFRLGYTGVDLFFVLSGFLITGILVRTRENEGYFTNFYARRVLRIWPLYSALLLFTFVLLPAIQPQLRAAIFAQSHPWQSFPFFLQNLFLNGHAYDTLRVTWSLAIEEQFYLVWPIVVWLAPRRMLKPLAVSGLLVSLALRWSVVYGLTPPVNIYTNTLTRLDGLALGAFLALWIPEVSSRMVKWTGIAVLAVAVPSTLAVAWLHEGHWSFYSLIALSFAGLLCVGINIQRAANLEFLKYTGKISYCLYLVHVPICSLMTLPRVHKLLLMRSAVWTDAVLFAVSIALCYAVASASWYFFESKILRLKSYFEFRTALEEPTPGIAAASTGSIRH